MRHARIALIIMFLGLSAAVFLLAARASADLPAVTPEPAPSPSAETTTTPQPADKRVVRDALRQRDRAARCGARLKHLSWCWGKHSKFKLAGRPRRAEPNETWIKAARKWQRQALSAKTRADALWKKMNDPGGSGWERWRPLTRYVWPARLVDTVIEIMRWESGGALHRWNFSGSGAFGFLQLLPKPPGVWTAREQLEYAYRHKYQAAGNSWSPWRGCRAFDYMPYW